MTLKTSIVIATLGVLIMVNAVPLPAGKNDPDMIYVAQTVFGEARGESWNGKVGVAWVIINRKKAHRYYFGYTIPNVVRKPWQFTCWRRKDVNYKKIHNPLKYDTVDTWLECYVVARLVLRQEVKDNTGGALYYIDESIIEDPPLWVAKLELSAQHGRLYFFREKSV